MGRKRVPPYTATPAEGINLPGKRAEDYKGILVYTGVTKVNDPGNKHYRVIWYAPRHGLAWCLEDITQYKRANDAKAAAAQRAKLLRTAPIDGMNFAGVWKGLL